jgi:CubicO group peptidase (beta-lactamase class C family)
MALDTLFRIYSMTKPVTSTALMMLVEEGKLRLSDPVTRYIPEFKDLKVMVPRSGIDYDLVAANRPITLHDLATHTAGLSYGFEAQSALDAAYRKTLERLDRDVEPLLEKRIVAFAQAGLPLAFQPGTAWRYSVALDVLGYVIQLAAGQPFDEFLQERIFDPLGMDDTGFWIPPEKVQRLAAVYGPAQGGGLRAIEPAAGSPFTKPTRNPGGGGGLVSTAADYFRFGQVLLNGGQLEGVRLLGRKTVEWMLQDHLPEGVRRPDAPGEGFGLGGAVLLRPGQSHRPGSPGKFGWGGAANTEWWIDPAEQLQCLLLLQYMPPFTIPIVEDFNQLAYQALL